MTISEINTKQGGGFFDDIVNYVNDDSPATDLKAYITAHSENNNWKPPHIHNVYDYKKRFYFTPSLGWRVSAIAQQMWKHLHEEAPLKRQLEVMQSGITGDFSNELGKWVMAPWWTKYFRWAIDALSIRAKNELDRVEYLTKLYGKSVYRLYLTKCEKTPAMPYLGRYGVGAVEGHWDQGTYYLTFEPINADSHQLRHYMESDLDRDSALIQLFMFLCYTPEGKRISYSKKFSVSVPETDTSNCLSYEKVHVHTSTEARKTLDRVSAEFDFDNALNMTQEELEAKNAAFIARSIEALEVDGHTYGVIRKGRGYVRAEESITTNTVNNTPDNCTSSYNFDLDEFMAVLRREKIEKGLLPLDYEEQRVKVLQNT